MVPNIFPRDNAQSGAVLIVSMIFLLVLTILGISSMSNATMEEKMSANAMNHSIAFHAAESSIEEALNDTSSLAAAISTGTPVTVNVNLGDPNITSSSEVTYIGAGAAPGFSLGENAGAFSSYRFDVTGAGVNSAAGANSTIVQGVTRIGPKV